jgi:hypothetical protein
MPPITLAQRVSVALAAVASITAALSFTFWNVFERDLPVTVGNMRGTALTMLLVAVPLLIGSMMLSARGSLRAQLVWLAAVAYIAYNAVLFCFAPGFNAFFLLFAALLALSFWALVTLFRAIDGDQLRAASASVPVRSIAVYLVASLVFFAYAWLSAIVPATLTNAFPVALDDAGISQNPVWVLDFAFTFPLMVLGAVWMWQRRAWGIMLGAMMTIMLTIETVSIGVDQWFGHIHDPAASLGAVPVMIGVTVVGLVFSILFLSGVRQSAKAPMAAELAFELRAR